MKWSRVADAAGCVLLVAACGGGGNGSGSFLGRASNAVLLVQWTQNGNHLTGDLQQALIQGSGTSGSESVSNQSVAFTGTINGSSVTLSLDQGLGSTTNLTGTLNGGVLDLNYPGQNGVIITVSMPSGTAADFNRDLASLQGRVQSANNRAQRAQAAQRQARSVAADATAVENDLGALRSAVSGLSATSSLGSDMAQLRKDVAQTFSDEQHVLNERGRTGSGTLCTDAATVVNDDGAVQSDFGAIQSDQGAVQSDSGAISGPISQLRNDAAVLNADRAQYPADVPPNAPTNLQVQAAIRSAQAKIGGENGSTGSALAQARQLLHTAHGYVNTAKATAHAACSASGGVL